jgi:NADH dehydrogenase/NADH:ubiquinone oxidoreductase subunit G
VGRTRLDLSSKQTKDHFQSLDQSTKCKVEDALKTLRDWNEQVQASIKEQAQETRLLQTQTQKTVAREINALTNKLEQQVERTRARTTDEQQQQQQQSQFQVIDAIADAATMHNHALSLGTENINATIEKETASTRVHIAGLVEANQEVMKTEINELKRGLQQLQSEIDRKHAELKDLVVKINTTQEGPKRQLMKKRGNAATVTLISLYELYGNLQVLANLMTYLKHRRR